MRLPSLLVAMILTTVCGGAGAAQQPAEQRVGLNEAAPAFDAKGAPAIEARLSTTALNGSDDSPVTNVRLVVKNTGASFYTYVTGWATFYDSGAVRCGEGLFKIDALAPGESSETDTPVNFIISIDGEQHPIQVGNPIVLKLGNRSRKIVLRPVP